MVPGDFHQGSISRKLSQDCESGTVATPQKQIYVPLSSAGRFRRHGMPDCLRNYWAARFEFRFTNELAVEPRRINGR